MGNQQITFSAGCIADNTGWYSCQLDRTATTSNADASTSWWILSRGARELSSAIWLVSCHYFSVELPMVMWLTGYTYSVFGSGTDLISLLIRQLMHDFRTVLPNFFLIWIEEVAPTRGDLFNSDQEEIWQDCSKVNVHQLTESDFC